MRRGLAIGLLALGACQAPRTETSTTISGTFHSSEDTCAPHP